MSKLRDILWHFGIAIIVMLVIRAMYKALCNWTADNVLLFVDSSARYLGHHYVWVELACLAVIISFIHVTLRISRRFWLGGTARNAGMFFYSLNSSSRALLRSKKFLEKKSLACKNIHINGATGWNTFGNPVSPLHIALTKCDSAEIILLSPLSDNIEVRAKDIKQTPEEYKNEILRSILFLKSIIDQEGYTTIKLKLCDSYPGWKYIFIDPYVWVQNYPKHEHVALSPSYAYQRLEGGIYDQLLNQFGKRWNSPWVCNYNFENDTIECMDKCPSTGHHSIKTLLEKARLA